MKNSYIRFVAFAVLMVLGTGTHAAVFTVKYAGTNSATVTINGAQYTVDRKKPVRVDTGLANVPEITWSESVVKGRDGVKDGAYFNPDTDTVFERQYAVTLKKPVGALNVGGDFTLFSGGAYSYYFGVDSNMLTVKGVASQVGDEKKVW